MFSIHSDPLASLGSQESGGQNIYVKYLAEELEKLGWATDTFTRWDSPHKKQIAYISKNSRVIRLKGGPVGYVPKSELFPIFPELFENFLEFTGRRNPYELFHGHYWDGGWMALEASQKFGKPFVENFHSIGIVRMETNKKFLTSDAENAYFANRVNLENRIIKNARAIISLAETEKQNLVRYYGCPEEKIKVIKGGVNLKHWPPVGKEKARKEIGMNGEPFIVLFVGRLEWRKGVGTLISAARLLKDTISNLHLLIVGGKIFGPNPNSADCKEHKRLVKKAEDEGIGDRITFVGNIDHGRLPFYYRAADIFVIPSYYEPFGLVALEGMASKVPVIASNVDGLAVTVENGKTGLLFEPRNILSLKEKIMDIYNSKDLAAALTGNAYAEITKNYSWSNIAKKIGGIYETLMAENLLPEIRRAHNPALN